MRTPHLLLAATLLAGAAGGAIAQEAANLRPSQLPAIQGKVAEYSLTPRGDVDGLILTDGTEVHLPPHLGTQLVFAVKPGDAVTVHGLRARAIPMVQAMSVSNDATGNTVTDNGRADRRGPRGTEQALTAQGRDQGTASRPAGRPERRAAGGRHDRPPAAAGSAAAGLANWRPGAPLYVQGDGFAGPLGRVIAAQSLGPNANQLTQVARRRLPRPPDRGTIRQAVRHSPQARKPDEGAPACK